MTNEGGHQYLGDTIQEHDEYLHQIWIRYQLFLVVMVDTDDTRHTTDDGRQTTPRYGISFPQVS